MDTEDKDLKLRPMKCELNFLTKSDGSAILAQGDTVTLASVNGPLDIKMQNQNIVRCTLEVQFCSKSGKTSITDRYKENAIRQTCEAALMGNLYPRTGLNITVQELEDYGGLVSCCVNSVCLALVNAGVGMRSVFAAVSCAVDSRGAVVLDPTQALLEDTTAVMDFVFEGKNKEVIASFTEGSFSEVAYKEALEKCKQASEHVFLFYRDIVKKYSKVLG